MPTPAPHSLAPAADGRSSSEAETLRRALVGMVRQSAVGAWAYFLLQALVVGLGDMGAVSVGVSLTFLGIQGGIAFARMRVSRTFEDRYARDPHAAVTTFAACACLAALTWGAFAGYVILVVGFTLSSFVLTIGTAGILAGGTMSLCMHHRLHLAWIAAQALPVILACSLMGTNAGYVLAGATVLFAAFMQRIGARHRDAIYTVLAQQTDLRRADRLKRMLLGNVSHEIRTPMTGVLGMAQALLQDPRNEHMRPKLRVIEDSTRTLLSLVDDLLSIREIEQGRVEIQRKPFELGGMVEQLGALLRPEARRRDLVISAEMHPDLPQRVVGDEDRLRQILLTMAGRSLRAPGTSRLHLRVAPGLLLDGQARLHFILEDDGPPWSRGDQELVERIQDRNQEPESMGGGDNPLDVTARLVRWLGGRVSLERRSDGLNRLRFSVPLEAAADSVDLAAAGGLAPGAVTKVLSRVMSSRATSQPKLSLHVLLVGPSGGSIEDARKALEHAGHQVSEVGDERALERVLKVHASKIDGVLVGTELGEARRATVETLVDRLRGQGRDIGVSALTRSGVQDSTALEASLQSA